MSPVKWWVVHGTSALMLQSIALKLVGQPCSSSCCERNWSTYNFIHSLKRNKLTPQRAKDFFMSITIFDLCQGDLQTIMKANLKCGTLEEMVLTQWIENDRILEIVDLSFDECELEVILFDSEGNASL